MKTFQHLWQYLADIFLQWKMFYIKVADKIKQTFHVQNLFPKIVEFIK
jgi:hypothetical protein